MGRSWATASLSNSSTKPDGRDSNFNPLELQSELPRQLWPTMVAPHETLIKFGADLDRLVLTIDVTDFVLSSRHQDNPRQRNGHCGYA